MSGTKIYFDTNIWIHYFERNPQFFEAASKIFTLTIAKKRELVSSELIYGEILAHYSAASQPKASDKLTELFDSLERLRLIEVSKSILISAAILRKSYSLKLPDAIHLATALEADCTILYTADKDFLEAEELITIEVID